MDLNYLHHRQQVSQFMSENASSDCARLVHREMANGYATQIADVRDSNVSVAAAKGSAK